MPTRPYLAARSRDRVKPGTKRAAFIEGLEFLGYVRIKITGKYYVYRRPDGDKNWYIGASGSLRIGKMVNGSHPAAVITKQYVLTATTVRPKVYAVLDELVPPLGSQAADLARTLQEGDPDLAILPLRVVLTHVLTWQKRQDREAA